MTHAAPVQQHQIHPTKGDTQSSTHPLSNLPTQQCMHPLSNAEICPEDIRNIRDAQKSTSINTHIGKDT
jgi:hypothetical protein